MNIHPVRKHADKHADKRADKHADKHARTHLPKNQCVTYGGHADDVDEGHNPKLLVQP